MQIDRYNHLLFPRDANSAGANNSNNNPAATPGKESSSAAAGGASGLPAKPTAGAPAARATARPEGVVLKIQWPDGDIASNPDPGVYTNGGKLASRPQPAVQDKQPDFVALAVSAMREYSDEHERLRVRTTADNAAATATTAPEAQHWGAFKGLQQIAAKLNVFA